LASSRTDFVDYCCELLAGIGPVDAKRMFGGYGISTGGVNVALIADLGEGDILWLKGDGLSAPRMEAAGSRKFTYTAKGVARSLNYFSAPDEAMESAQAMAPWARAALDCALRRRLASPKPRRASATRASPRPSPPKARAPKASARRKSSHG
jgi:DNA transformation protein